MIKSELKKAGLKVTGPRSMVLALFEEAVDKHLSAESILISLQEKGEKVALATVYRVLTQFVAAGLIIRHRFDEQHSVYELAPDEHHDHIVCTQCHQVEEFFDDIIEQHQDKIAKKMGYQITDHSLYLYGICATCQKINTPISSGNSGTSTK